MRRTLLVLAAVLLAGCTVGTPGATPTDTDPGDSETVPSDTAGPDSPESPTPALGECGSPRTTDDGNARLTPKPHPSVPETLSNETAATHAAAFEESYAWNGALSDDVRSATVSVTVTNVTQIGDGYVVTLDIHAGYTERVTVDDGTPIEQAADDWYDAAYFVTDSVLRRSVTRTDSATPDARNGAVVACYGE
jgi:hypothetical protein